MTARRPRVLVHAYACEPGRGSEPGAGWEWTMAAAAHHDVWLVTSRRHREPVEAALADHRPAGLRAVVYLEDEVGALDDWRVPGHAQLRYLRWQRAARAVLRRLHAEHDLDLAHHLTWATDWQPTAVAHVPGLPYVWGPVGGASPTSLRLARWLGVRGTAAELSREAITRGSRRVWSGRTARGAALLLAQNDDVRRRFASCGPVVVAPNAAIRLPVTIGQRPTRADAVPPSGGPEAPAVPGAPATRRRAVFAGRLVGWKGIRLAVAAVAACEWELDVFGFGPEKEAATRLAARRGAADRIRFHGSVPRAEALGHIAAADALLLPSIHDSSPWVVAEAMALGTPVVCLDRGGPPNLARVPEGGVAVPVSAHVVRDLVAALDTVGERSPVDWWDAARLPDEIATLYQLALEGNAVRSAT